MKVIKILSLALAATAFVSCANETSLQEYYVENQQDNKFIAVDVPTSMFTNTEELDETQKETLETVKVVKPVKITISLPEQSEICAFVQE